MRADRRSGSLQQTPSPRATPPTTRAQPTVHGADARRPLDVGEPRAVSSLRPFDAARPGNAARPGDASRPDARPPHRSRDVRYSRPASHAVRPPTYAHTRVPVRYTYRPWYSRWYCHPWYRYRYSTWAVVGFGFSVYAWNDVWVPPARWGWIWRPGFWSWGYWHPGYWSPVAPGPVGYVYVPGWWEHDVYVEGYYRTEARDGWEWVEGHYLEDGFYVRGHWIPSGAAPEGYVWEPGLWDGEQYVDGFWRPQFRKDFVWVSAFYDADGIFHSGYWMPAEERPGFEWIPGWFDGNEWQPGYWVEISEIEEGALDDFEPPPGYDDGWDDVEAPPVAAPGETPEARLIERYRDRTGEDPLAVPVVIPEAGE